VRSSLKRSTKLTCVVSRELPDSERRTTGINTPRACIELCAGLHATRMTRSLHAIRFQSTQWSLIDRGCRQVKEKIEMLDQKSMQIGQHFCCNIDAADTCTAAEVMTSSN